ncbi:hypothetical protein E3983_00110 [Legionella israelensis]|uniref:Uncharacterized protein n=1 Tax=Legionella israelensis TaxID=454 RepID=A0AAX1ECQ9_9GAMM|nr:hypothetical protein [Legionella israelensis]QBR82900.1 hypothetical protein E3983_00110 [Legionella israelensis]
MTRTVLYLFSIALYVLGILLISQQDWLASVWIWPDAPWFSDVFMTSVIFAAATAYSVCATNGKLRPLYAISISSIVTITGITFYYYMFSASPNPETQMIRGWGVFLLMSLFINIWFFIVSYNADFESKEPFPTSLKWFLSFVMLINLQKSFLLIAGIKSFAWEISLSMAVVYGWTLFGGLIFVILVLLEPYWENVWPLFVALIAYDLVLIGPIIFSIIFQDVVPITSPRRLYSYGIAVIITFLMVVYYSMKKGRQRKLNKG